MATGKIPRFGAAQTQIADHCGAQQLQPTTHDWALKLTLRVKKGRQKGKSGSEWMHDPRLTVVGRSYRINQSFDVAAPLFPSMAFLATF